MLALAAAKSYHSKSGKLYQTWAICAAFGGAQPSGIVLLHACVVSIFVRQDRSLLILLATLHSHAIGWPSSSFSNGTQLGLIDFSFNPTAKRGFLRLSFKVGRFLPTTVLPCWVFVGNNHDQFRWHLLVIAQYTLT